MKVLDEDEEEEGDGSEGRVSFQFKSRIPNPTQFRFEAAAFSLTISRLLLVSLDTRFSPDSSDCWRCKEGFPFSFQLPCSPDHSAVLADSNRRLRCLSRSCFTG